MSLTSSATTLTKSASEVCAAASASMLGSTSWCTRLTSFRFDSGGAVGSY